MDWIEKLKFGDLVMLEEEVGTELTGVVIVAKPYLLQFAVKEIPNVVVFYHRDEKRLHCDFGFVYVKAIRQHEVA